MWILVPVIGIILSILTESGSNIVECKECKSHIEQFYI